jgi:hypothetical protein
MVYDLKTSKIVKKVEGSFEITADVAIWYEDIEPIGNMHLYILYVIKIINTNNVMNVRLSLLFGFASFFCFRFVVLY